MFKGKITDVFFDLDHTLWDFERNSALTFEKIFKLHEVRVDLSRFLEIYVPINFQYWKKYRNGEITQDRLRYGRLKTTFDALGFAVTDSKLHRLSKAYIQHLTTFNHLFPNTITLLKYLSEQYDLHIITNGFAEIQNKKLSNSSIIHYFKVIVNSDMAGVKKPHPAIFQMALRKAKVAPSLALMIGDNLEADILGAQRQGMAAVHFNSNREPTHKYCPIVYGLNEIKHLL